MANTNETPISEFIRKWGSLVDVRQPNGLGNKDTAIVSLRDGELRRETAVTKLDTSIEFGEIKE